MNKKQTKKPSIDLGSSCSSESSSIAATSIPASPLEDLYKSKRPPFQNINLNLISSKQPSVSPRYVGPTPPPETPDFSAMRIKTPTATIGRPVEKIDLNFPKLSSSRTNKTVSLKSDTFISLNSTSNLNAFSTPPIHTPRLSSQPPSSPNGSTVDAGSHVDWFEERIDTSLSDLTKYENFKFQRWNRTLEQDLMNNPPNVYNLLQHRKSRAFITDLAPIRSSNGSRNSKSGNNASNDIEEDSAESIIRKKQSRNRYMLKNRTSLAESKNQRPSTSFELYKKQLLDAEEKFDSLDNSWKEFGMTSTSSFIEKISSIDVKKSSMREIEDDLKRKIYLFKENANKKNMQNHIQEIKLLKRKKMEDMKRAYGKDVIEQNKELASKMTREALDEKRAEASMLREEKIKTAREINISNILEKKHKTEELIREREMREEIRNMQRQNMSLYTNWKTIVTIIHYLYVIKDTISKAYEYKQAQEKKALEEASKPVEVDAQDADYEKKIKVFNVLFKERYASHLERIKALIGRGVRRWREQKKYESIQLISKFLTDLAETFRIPLAVSKFKNAVIKVQRTWRSYVVMKKCQKILHVAQLGKYIEKKIASLEKEINKGNGRKGVKNDTSSHALNKMMSSATLGVQNSKVLFDLVAQKEEIKKISIELKEEVVNNYYEERRIEHVRKMRIFEKESQLMKKDSKSTAAMFQDFKPKLSPLLSKNELHSLFEQCFKRTRMEIQTKEKTSSARNGQEPKKLNVLDSQRSNIQLFKLARQATSAAMKFKAAGAKASSVNLFSDLHSGRTTTSSGKSACE
ncbi:hypothetical protein C9374_011003 [Naegleria lovaniensis]|uniref:Uncharacterized protein n=1 Tax=Naegleria lovaniensis TaxID=51637 RepID=A0AA88KFL1_NAELO|nr:uncharacterized protein C9374_011003 [Naegleria lovaniensis]KAG2374166.1 hypothetical protein C9374_011003 [Naegleria lovaniensis]